MVTIKDVARRAQVSPATVSRVINDYPHVSAELRVRVKKAIADLNYSPNELARSFKMKKTMTIGLILSDITNPFYSESAKAVVETAGKLGYTVFLCTTNNYTEKQDHYIRILRQKRVDGLIFASVQFDDTSIQKLAKQKVKYILYNRKTADPDTNYVVLDNEHGSFLAVQYLVKLGHTRIGYIKGLSASSNALERYHSYVKALEYFGLPYDKEIVVDGNYDEKQSYIAVGELLRLPERPTAIISANDLMAFCAMKRISEAGLRIPQDISLIGFDDVYMSKHPYIQLTTLTQNKYQMAEIAARCLIQLIKGEINQLPIQITLKPHLVVRGTTGPCPYAGMAPRHLNRWGGVPDD